MILPHLQPPVRTGLDLVVIMKKILINVPSSLETIGTKQNDKTRLLKIGLSYSGGAEFYEESEPCFGQRHCIHSCPLQGVMRGIVLKRSEFGKPNTRCRVNHQPRVDQQLSPLQASKSTECLKEKINKTSRPRRRKPAKLSMSSTRSLPYSLVTPSRGEEFQLIDNNRMQTSTDKLCPSAYH